MHPTNWTCCTETQEMPWWSWLILGAIALGIVIRIIWVWRSGGFRPADTTPQEVAESAAASYPEVWARASADRLHGLLRPTHVPRPESVEEVEAWVGSEGFRRTELIYAPSFWVFLPLAALGFLIQQTIADPTGSRVGITINGENVDSWPAWLLWLVWLGVGTWLLIAVGVLLLRLSILSDLRVENEWIYEHGVAHSIHRASVDYDDGESSGWPTYIALDHRLDDAHAERIHEAFEQWLSLAGLPPSGSEPISSATLFGAQAKGGYFILHLPISQTAGFATKRRWMLITEPRDSEYDVIVTPVPERKRLLKMRIKARQKAARTAVRRAKSAARSEPADFDRAREVGDMFLREVGKWRLES